MSLPAFNSGGDLPPGVYRATMEEVMLRFGSGTPSRERAASALLRIYQTAKNTGRLERIVIFGSFVTAKAMPNDVDVILVMNDGFRLESCDHFTAAIFDHERAQREIGASVFWIRPSLLIADAMPEFISRWQKKRDGGLRGIVEVMND